jgi:hypothetical protein
MTYIELDNGDVKLIRRMILEMRSGNMPSPRADANYLEELLDEAEGIVRQPGIVLNQYEDGSVKFEYDQGIKRQN